MPKLWKIHLSFLPRSRVHRQWSLFWRDCTCFNHQILPDSGPKNKKMFYHHDFDTPLRPSTKALLPYDFFLFGVFGNESWWHHNDSKNFNPQPSSRLPSLLNFARIFLPIKYTFSYSKIRRNKLLHAARSRRISSRCWTSRRVFKANFWISSSRRSCLVGVDVSCSGLMDAGSMRSLGLLPMANSIGAYHSGLPVYFSLLLPCASAEQVWSVIEWSRPDF